MTIHWSCAGHTLTISERGEILDIAGLGGTVAMDPLQSMPYQIRLRRGDEIVTLTPREAWGVQIQAGESLVCRTQGFTKDSQEIPLELVYSLTPEDESLVLRVTIESLPPGYEGVTCKQLLSGLHLGPGESLAFPAHAGEIIPDPATELSRPMEWANARWHNYYVSRPLRGVPGVRQIDGEFLYSAPYCGYASMSWMDLFTTDRGLYLGSHDPEFGVVYLQVGASENGLSLGFERPFAPLPWAMPPMVFAIHSEDWHWGARTYRRWAESWWTPPRPAPWFLEEDGVMVHYDLKFQNQEICHTFREIPALQREALDLGLRHLYLSAWMEGGFDTLYPQFFPDLQLGTIRELMQGVREAKAQGGRVSFYINSRIINKRSAFFESLGQEWAAHTQKGEQYTEKYGAEEFISACAAHPRWLEVIGDFILWLVESVGADGVYIDQIGAPPRLCYNPDHHHTHPGEWNRGYRSLLERITKEAANPNLFFMMEGCGDLHAPFLSAQLTHAAWGLYSPYTRAEVYRYTFPEVTPIDMVFPKPVPLDSQALQISPEDLVLEQFLLGVHYWIYDHTPKDPVWPLVGSLMTLRRKGSHYFQQGFRDEDGLQLPENGRGKVYHHPQGSDHGLMLALRGGVGLVQVELAHSGHWSVITQTLSGQVHQEQIHGQTALIPLPQEQAALVFIEPR